MRIFKRGLVVPLIGIWLLAGCNRAASDDIPAGDRIDCAVGGAEFASACTIERGAGTLIVHHPDGGFRRLSVDGQGAVSAADGAEIATSSKRKDGRIEVQVGQDHYVIGGSAAETHPQ